MDRSPSVKCFTCFITFCWTVGFPKVIREAVQANQNGLIKPTLHQGRATGPS